MTRAAHLPDLKELQRVLLHRYLGRLRGHEGFVRDLEAAA